MLKKLSDRELSKEHKDLEMLHELKDPSFYKKRWPRRSRMDYSSKARKEKITRS